tara:strand:+ start:284 stop:526 length:243 start_codon:yes stop_codon:yes gene_type:complete
MKHHIIVNKKKELKMKKNRNEKREGWLCDNCLSENIVIFTEDNRQEMDCYCYDCKDSNYIVSAWFARDRFKNEKRRINND